MNKLVFASIIAIVISYIGIAMKRIYKKRLRYLEDMQYFIDANIENINSTRDTINVLIERMKGNVDKDFSRTLDRFKEAIYQDKPLIISNICLNIKNREIIQNCFNTLGRNDKSIELEKLKTYKIVFVGEINKAKEDVVKKGELYAKLGIMLGIAMLIILM